MKIFDVHVHLGEDVVFDEKQTEEEILSAHQSCGVTGGLVQPFIPRTSLAATRAIHDRIKAFCDANPGYFGMTSIDPHFRPEDYGEEVERCVKELGFRAVKLTPYAHACPANSASAYDVYRVANQLGVPVMVHTGNGFPFADVAKLEDPLRDFPELTFVIAHCNLDSGLFKTLSICERFPNTCCEPSWCSATSLAALKKCVGAERILYSSDLLIELAPQRLKFENAFTRQEQELAFHANAERIFKLSTIS